MFSKTILITGGAGSIAKMFLRTILSSESIHCIALDNDDTELYRLQQEMQQFPGKLTLLLDDITNYSSLESTILSYKPDWILHTAAHKQVSLLESFPERAFLINTEASLRLFQLGLTYNIPIVFLSSDKSVEPTGVLGLSKWMAEAAFLWWKVPGCILRLPNLWDSKGSFFTEFPSLYKKTGVVPLTDMESTRYLLSETELREAFIELTYHLDRYSHQVLIPAQAPKKVVIDFLTELMQKEGIPQKAITLTGLRPGEKKHEKLHWDEEILRETDTKFFNTTTSTPVTWQGVDVTQSLYQENSIKEQISDMKTQFLAWKARSV